MAGIETSVPAGTVTPLENVNGRNARRVKATGLGEKKLESCTGVTERESTNEGRNHQPAGSPG